MEPVHTTLWCPLWKLARKARNSVSLIRQQNTWVVVNFHVQNNAASCHSKFEPPHDKTNKRTVHPAKTQHSLGIHPVWSEPSLCAQWVAKDPSFLHADNADSDQTGRMPRPIWVFAGRTCHFAGLVTSWLILGSTRNGWAAVQCTKTIET